MLERSFTDPVLDPLLNVNQYQNLDDAESQAESQSDAEPEPDGEAESSGALKQKQKQKLKQKLKLGLKTTVKRHWGFTSREQIPLVHGYSKYPFAEHPKLKTFETVRAFLEFLLFNVFEREVMHPDFVSAVDAGERQRRDALTHVAHRPRVKR